LQKQTALSFFGNIHDLFDVATPEASEKFCSLCADNGIADLHVAFLLH
jgi:hypothetical protein